MLSVNELNAFYGKSHVVRGLSFRASTGHVLGLLGRNGVGKTTTMRALMGLVRRNGSVELGGREIGILPPHEVSRAGLAYVPQGRLLFPHLTVEENLRLAFHGTQFGSQALTLGIGHFPPLHDLLHRKAETLSGGEQQMVAIGRALINRPQAILMDEPSEGLSPLFVERVASVISQIKTDMTIVLVEQSLPLALAACDEICFVEKGSIAHCCSPDDPNMSDLLDRYLGVGVSH